MQTHELTKKWSVWDAGTKFRLLDGMYKEGHGFIHGISLERMEWLIKNEKAKIIKK